MASRTSFESPRVFSAADCEQSFFRAWRISSSEHAPPYNTSAPSSPISPFTITNQRKTNRSSYLQAQSEVSHFSLDTPEEGVIYSASARPLPNIVPDGPPLLKVTPPSNTRLPYWNDWPRSSISNRARKILQGSKNRSASENSIDTDPQRAAKIGYKWKRGISGHWLETGNKRKKQWNEQSWTDSEDATIGVPHATPISRTPRASEPTPKGISMPLERLNRLEKLPRLERSQKNGFYYRTKRRLRVSVGSSESVRERLHSKTNTEDLLERAGHILLGLTERNRTPLTSSASGSSQSIAAWHNHKVRLVSIYPRKGNSSSSSIQSIHSGRLPQATPEPHAMYTGSDSRQYFRVEMSSPDGPTYLPSEARRISTPRLPNSAAGKQLRGFFFDYNAPVETATTPSPEPVERSTFMRQKRRTQRSSEVDWYRVKLAADEAKDAQLHFELNVPEHLPNSPLCPRNPKHRSGGEGVCVYHGRNKAKLSDDGSG